VRICVSDTGLLDSGHSGELHKLLCRRELSWHVQRCTSAQLPVHTSRAPDDERDGGTTVMQCTPLLPPPATAARPGAGSGKRCSRGSCTSGTHLGGSRQCSEQWRHRAQPEN